MIGDLKRDPNFEKYSYQFSKLGSFFLIVVPYYILGPEKGPYLENYLCPGAPSPTSEEGDKALTDPGWRV